MAPLQIILLLLVVRLPRSLATAEGGAGALPHFMRAPAWVHMPESAVVASFLLAQLVLVAFVFQRTAAALRLLNQPSASSVAVTTRTDSLFQHARWATIALTAIPLYALGLPAIVIAWLGRLGLGGAPLLPETIYIVPALLAWLAIWLAAYRVETANRDRSLPFRLAAGLPAHEMPGLGQFLWMQVRHNFYIIVPIGAAMLMEDVSDRLEHTVPYASEFGVLLAFAALILLMPWFITRAWDTVPLAGPLRVRLDAMARQYGLRFRNILIWKTHNAITNAAILGYLPFSRYFLMTDALLETMTDQQLEAVFAHEVGHGVHRHIWWYLAFLVTVLMLSTSGTELLVPHLGFLAARLGGADAVDVMLNLGLLALFVTLGFPLISHRFEHQADWFAAQHMAEEKAAHPGARPVPAYALAGEQGELLAIPGAALAAGGEAGFQGATANLAGASGGAAPAGGASAGGAEVFISALDMIADLAHRSRDKKGWMHPSINNRIRLLRELAGSAMARKAFAWRMVRARVCLAVLLLVAIALTAYSSMSDQPAHHHHPAASSSER